MCKSVSIAVYSSSVKFVILNPAVGYTSSVIGTSIHTYWFPVLSCIVNPFFNVVPDTWVKPVGKYGFVVFLLDTVSEPPFASSPGCFGSAFILTPISDFKFSFVSSIGVFSNLTVTFNIVSSCAFNVVFSNEHITSKYSSFELVASAVKSADISELRFFTVYVATASSPLAFNPVTFTLPCVLSSELIVAVVVPFPLVLGVPINSTLKFSCLACAFPTPFMFKPTLVIAAYATATNIIAISSIPPTIFVFFPPSFDLAIVLDALSIASLLV